MVRKKLLNQSWILVKFNMWRALNVLLKWTFYSWKVKLPIISIFQPITEDILSIDSELCYFRMICLMICMNKQYIKKSYQSNVFYKTWVLLLFSKLNTSIQALYLCQVTTLWQLELFIFENIFIFLYFFDFQ